MPVLDQAIETILAQIPYYSHTPNARLSNIVSTEKKSVVCSQEGYQRTKLIFCLSYPVQVLSAWSWGFPKTLHN